METLSRWQIYLRGFAKFSDLKKKITCEFSRVGKAPGRVWTARIAQFEDGPFLSAHEDLGVCHDNFWLALEREWRSSKMLRKAARLEYRDLLSTE